MGNTSKPTRTGRNDLCETQERKTDFLVQNGPKMTVFGFKNLYALKPFRSRRCSLVRWYQFDPPACSHHGRMISNEGKQSVERFKNPKMGQNRRVRGFSIP